MSSDGAASGRIGGLIRGPIAGLVRGHRQAMLISALVVTLLGLTSAASGYDRASRQTILPGVRIAGASVGGMTGAEAAPASGCRDPLGARALYLDPGHPDPQHAGDALGARVCLPRLHPHADVGGRGAVPPGPRRHSGAGLRAPPWGLMSNPGVAGT